MFRPFCWASSEPLMHLKVHLSCLAKLLCVSAFCFVDTARPNRLGRTPAGQCLTWLSCAMSMCGPHTAVHRAAHSQVDLQQAPHAALGRPNCQQVTAHHISALLGTSAHQISGLWIICLEGAGFLRRDRIPGTSLSPYAMAAQIEIFTLYRNTGSCIVAHQNMRQP